MVEASRLCDTARGGEILVADLVRALSRGRGGFTFEAIGDLADAVEAARARTTSLPG